MSPIAGCIKLLVFPWVVGLINSHTSGEETSYKFIAAIMHELTLGNQVGDGSLDVSLVLSWGKRTLSRVRFWLLWKEAI